MIPSADAPTREDGEALRDMEARKDAAYLERNQVVAALAMMVLRTGGKAGTKRTAIEGWSDDWHGCVFMDLPTGQASWHYHDSHAHLFTELPPYGGDWDGHSTPEKYERLAALRAGHAARGDEARDAENRWLRRKLCAVYAGHLAYMDDGEAQDGREYPFIDFLRDSPESIEAAMQERANRAAIAAMTKREGDS